jgi:hypothetical protein
MCDFRIKEATAMDGSPIGDCEPPHATGQEMTITKVTNQGSPGYLGPSLGTLLLCRRATRC